MSVVAYDGTFIAADRRGTNGNLMVTCSKLRRLESGEVIAAVGLYEDGIRLMDWYEQGADPALYPDMDREIITTLIVASSKSIFYFGRTPTRLPVLDEVMAWGSGADFAIGAMKGGADAMRAVEIANECDAYCGNGVECFTL